MTSGDRLKLARELRGLTQTSLAGSLRLSQSTISSIESGRIEPSGDVLSSAALTLGLPLSFFTDQYTETFPLGSLVLYRARKSLTMREESQSRRLAQVIFECVTHLATRLKVMPSRIPQLSDPPDTAAAITRDALGLSPDEPIPHLVRSLEQVGANVLALPLVLPRIDAFSLWAGEDPAKPIIAVTDGKAGDRLRWSTAHELGHLVLHRSIRGSAAEAEAEANAFAAELLLPENVMREELPAPLTLNALAMLKSRWRVSMQALIMRAADLEIITQRQKKYLFMKFSKAGWRKHESTSKCQSSRPLALRRMIELLFGSPTDTTQSRSGTQDFRTTAAGVSRATRSLPVSSSRAG